MRTKHTVARQLLDKVEKAGGKIRLTENGAIRYQLPGDEASGLVEELRPYRAEIHSLLIAQLPPLWGTHEDGYRVQPTTEQIIEGVQAGGGGLWLDDDYRLRFHLPKKNFKQLKAVLKHYRTGVFHHLLAAKPKTYIPTACRCSQKPYPHLTHDPPRGDEQPEVRFKGDPKQLREALIRCQGQPEGWDMGNLVECMEGLSKRKSE